MYSGRLGSAAPQRLSVFRAPAVQALLIQVASFAIIIGLAVILPLVADVQLTIAHAALLQGAIAALFARLLSMASWWLIIQFLFPVAVIVLNALQLPSWLYLASFVVLLCVYWTTFRTQVPYYPSTLATWNTVNALLPMDRSVRFVDVGSGFGGLVMHLAHLRPASTFAGIEAAPLPWFVSFLRARLGRGAGRFVRGDYSELDFGSYDVVFAYLSPAAMPGLWSKACAEMRQGALLLSYEFPVPGVDPHVIRQPRENGPALYGWYF